MKKLKSISELERCRQDIQSKQEKYETIVSVCGGTGCQAYDCQKVKGAFQKELKNKNLTDKVALKITGCPGFCERGPLVTIYPYNIFYQRVKAEDVAQIVSETIQNGRKVERLLFEDSDTHRKTTSSQEIPFYRAQKRLLLSYNDLLDPTHIEDYVGIGGYRSLAKALFQMRPEEIIEEMKASGLRGRGGAGYPTGKKWENCRKSPGEIKYVICN